MGCQLYDKSKVIVISLGSPYIGNEYFERVKTYINTIRMMLPRIQLYYGY
jgi:hypothetical protein